jgi:hypothetical protein
MNHEPRLCRMLLGFEPAFAGGPRSRNAALAQAYRVVSVEVKTLLGGVGSKRERNTRTQQGSISYTIFNSASIEEN